MAKSILQSDKECYLCRKRYNLRTTRSLEEHHILFGRGRRELSEQYGLRDALEDVAENYDYCLLDCPPDLDMGSINALCAADWVIIPVDCDEWACDGMDEIIDQIERVQMYYNPRLKIMGAMMTKYRRTKYAVDVIRRLSAQGVPMLRTVIRYTVKVSEAKSAHKPLREFAPKCTATDDYKALAGEVDEIVSNVDTEGGHNNG